MKIAFLLPRNTIGGGVFCIYEHAKRLSQKNHDITIFFEDKHSSLEINCYSGLEQVTFKHLADQGNLADQENLEPFDFAVATAWQTVYILDQIQARQYCYFVQDNERNFHSAPNRFSQPFIEKTYQEELIFFVTTQWLAEMLAEEFSQEAIVIPYSIDFSRFGLEKAAYPRAGRRKRVVIEGSASIERKRISLAFSVMAHFPDTEVFYVSGDDEHQKSWRIDKHFIQVPHEEMPKIYASCDILLKLSSQESFALPVLEMFASGGTSVVTAFTGHDAYIRHNENALVVPIDDETAAVEAMTRLLQDDGLLNRLKEGARDTCHSFVSWETSNDRFEQAFLELSGRPESAGEQLPLLKRSNGAYQDYCLIQTRLSRSERTLQAVLESRTYQLARAMAWPLTLLRRRQADNSEERQALP